MIRKIVNSDIEKVNEILESNFHVSLNLKQPFVQYLVYDDGEIWGLISYSNLYDSIDLNYIWVEKKHRNQGIASKLIKSMIEEAKNQDIKNITLEVSEENVIAIHLYQKFGFVKKAVRKNYYGNQDGILMLLEVR